MNKADISKEKIVEISLTMLKNNNAIELNMRDVAKGCGVSVGSIYNYFPTKADLILAVIEGVWKKIFDGDIIKIEGYESFTKYIEEMYHRVYNSQMEYHNFFAMHRDMMGINSKLQGRSNMKMYIQRIKCDMLEKLNTDTEISNEIWTGEFTKEKFINFIFQNISSLLAKKQEHCSFFIKVLDKILYTK